MSSLLLRRSGLSFRSQAHSLSRRHGLPHLTPSRLLHVRTVSIFSGVGRLAGRTAGRGALGVGVGAGALTWAEWKVDGFKQNATDFLSEINETLGETFDSVSTTAVSAFATATETTVNSYSTLSKAAAETWADTALNVSSGFASLSERIRDAFPVAVEEEEKGDSLKEEEGYGKNFDESREGGEGGGRGGGGSKKPLSAAAAALATSLPVIVDAEETFDFDEDSSAGDLMLLTKRLIEIRSILLSIGEEAGLHLPSIVVIGSQSSGKSSVLEAIVGREFLPKGDNMVTRRPIELTLIHTPPTKSDPFPSTFAEFPSLGPGHITDFSLVQQTLVDLNLSVPVEECVSDVPIQLRIHSPNVPDLSLVDLPGYVQISSMDQPEQLKGKISALCDKYIRSPNIILAVCAADVDLANSPALRASKKVDPLGMRTIGVVTKMDLVLPEAGTAILTNSRYPLALGFVGVVCKAGHSHKVKDSLFSKSREVASPSDSSDLTAPIKAQEEAFFGSHREQFSKEGVLVGTGNLKKRLMQVLEESMANSLHTISNTVSLELEEAKYQFKVQYNDRSISAESYVAETMDQLKARIVELGKGFSKIEVRRMLKAAIDEQVLDLLAQQYWSDSKLKDLGQLGKNSRLSPEDLDLYWQRKLDAISSSLTKSGIGRTATQLVVDAIRSSLASLASNEPLTYHPDAADRIGATADAILRDRFSLTSDQVENSVKPYKYEVEVEPKEWENGRLRSSELINRELSMCEGALNQIRETVGGRKLRGAMEYIGELEERDRRRRERRREMKASHGDDYVETDDDMADPTRPAYNPALLAKAREAMFLTTRGEILRLRLTALKAKRCRSGPDQKAFCPEAFLNVVADKLSHTAVQFINIELLVEFFYQFPREIDSRLGYDLNRAEVLQFAKENPVISRHLALQERKEKLELVAEKLDSLVKLQQDKAQTSPLRRQDHRRGLFGMF